MGPGTSAFARTAPQADGCDGSGGHAESVGAVTAPTGARDAVHARSDERSVAEAIARPKARGEIEAIAPGRCGLTIAARRMRSCAQAPFVARRRRAFRRLSLGIVDPGPVGPIASANAIVVAVWAVWQKLVDVDYAPFLLYIPARLSESWPPPSP
jgi:hypothetical protein